MRPLGGPVMPIASKNSSCVPKVLHLAIIASLPVGLICTTVLGASDAAYASVAIFTAIVNGLWLSTLATPTQAFDDVSSSDINPYSLLSAVEEADQIGWALL